MHLVIIDADEQYPVITQQLPRQQQTRVHHVQPAGMQAAAVIVLAGVTGQGQIGGHGMAIIVRIQKAPAGIIGRIDIDHFHLAAQFRLQMMQHRQVVALDDAMRGRPAGQRRPLQVFQAASGHPGQLGKHGLLAWPVKAETTIVTRVVEGKSGLRICKIILTGRSIVKITNSSPIHIHQCSLRSLITDFSTALRGVTVARSRAFWFA